MPKTNVLQMSTLEGGDDRGTLGKINDSRDGGSFVKKETLKDRLVGGGKWAEDLESVGGGGAGDNETVRKRVNQI